MRNLKRVLSLALACVMVIGMMVMTTGAADFGDYDEIEYVEAVEVMSAIKVLEGDDLGNFNPTDILTREQAAKIICYMLLGAENAEKLNANNTIFKDVAAGRWSAGYISYCATLGIIAGVGDGNFDPTGELTGVAFGKMLLVALGYDPKIEGYVGADWATEIATDIISAGIDVKGVVMSDALTREQAAQMAFQTLTADMVDYADRGWEMTLDNGQTIIMGASKPHSITRTEVDNTSKANYAASGNEGDGYLQFCEKHFGSLKKTVSDRDEHGRPGHSWANMNKGIILVLDAPVATFDGRTKASDVAVALNGTKIRFGATTYKTNNVLSEASALNKTNLIYANDYDTAVGTMAVPAGSTLTVPAGKTIAEAVANLTANGKTVEVYTDKANNISTIVTCEYTVAKVTKIDTDKAKTTYNFTAGVPAAYDYVNDNIDDTIDLQGAVRPGSIVTVIMGADGLKVYPTTTVVGTQSAFTTIANTIVVDGTTYKVGVGVADAVSAGSATGYVALGDFSNEVKACEYYIDQFGYVVGTDNIVSDEYVYIVSADSQITTNADGKVVTVSVRAVLADGTTGVYNVLLEKDSSGNFDLMYDGTQVVAYDASANTAADAALEGKVFGYTLSGNDLLLESLPAIVDNTTPANQVYYVALDSSPYVAKFQTKYSEDGNTILVNDATAFVVYNPLSKRTTTYVGPDALPTEFDGSNVHVGTAVLRMGQSQTGVASVVFVVGNIGADATDKYAFVNTNSYTVTQMGGMTVYTYNAWTDDGEVIKLSKKMSKLDNGGHIYAYTADGEVKGDIEVRAVNCTVTGFNVTQDLVTDDGTTYYQLTEDTKIVYVDDEISGDIDGKYGWLVRAVVNGVVTTKIETVYVVAE